MRTKVTTKNSQYSTLNASNGWTVTKMARRFATTWSLDCCCVPCYPNTPRHSALRTKPKDYTTGETSSDKILKDLNASGRDDGKTREQIELNSVGSNDSLIKNEVTPKTHGSFSLIERATYRGSMKLEESSSPRSYVDYGDKSSTSNVTLTGYTRIVEDSSPVVPKIVEDPGDEKKDSESDCDCDSSEMFPKCRIRKTKKQKSLDNGSENEACQFTCGLTVDHLI